MKRNNESRNQSGNYRTGSRKDQFNDWHQSSDQRRNRNQDAERNESEWDRNAEWRSRDYPGNARLDSMGALGNDWTNRKDRSDNEYYQGGNAGGRNSGNYGAAYDSRGLDRYRDRNNSSDYENDSRYDDRYRNRLNTSDIGNEGRNWWDKTKDEVSGWFGDENAQLRRDRDGQGEHKGKGPKGYIRTDERIKEDVHERLTEDSWLDATEIEADVKNGEVFLKGTVKNRREKRRAEDLIENISGVKNVENHIKVQTEGSNSWNPSQSAGPYDEKRFEVNAGSGKRPATSGEYNAHN